MVSGSENFGLGDFESPKELKTVQRNLRLVDASGRVFEGPSFPMDYQANFAYHSRMDGFVPVEVAADTIFSNPFHYGAGLFEGIKLHRSPYGDAFIELAHNIGRAIFSSMAFDRSLITQTLDFMKDENVDHITHLQRTPEQFFADSVAALKSDDRITMGVEVHYKNGRIERKKVPFHLKVKTGNEVREFSMREIEGAIYSLVMLNGLVRGGNYTPEIQSIPGGYIRLVSWISGEEGLKVPTIISRGGEIVYKPLYLGVGTLPWGGKYLENDGGINVLIAPLRRVNDSMPVTQKISGNYVNSAQNVNLGILLGYGEIIALNQRGRIAEGSAENLLIIMKEKNKYRVYCPPLSSNVLAGTTRDRLNRILKKGLKLDDGCEIELVMEAPKKEKVLEGLDCEYLVRGAVKKTKGRKSESETVAIILMGTGAGLVHANSISEIAPLKEWVRCDQLRSEELVPRAIHLPRLEQGTTTYPINGGRKHPIVSLLEAEYQKFVLDESGKKLTMPYMIDPNAFVRIFDMHPIDLLESGEERKVFMGKVESEHYQQRINGVTHPEELKSRYLDWLALVHKANEISIQRRTVRR